MCLSYTAEWANLVTVTQLLSSHLSIHFIYDPVFSLKWPRGLRRGSAAACYWDCGVRILPGLWVSVSCECCVFSLRRADRLSRKVLR